MKDLQQLRQQGHEFQDTSIIFMKIWLVRSRMFVLYTAVRRSFIVSLTQTHTRAARSGARKERYTGTDRHIQVDTTYIHRIAGAAKSRAPSWSSCRARVIPRTRRPHNRKKQNPPEIHCTQKKKTQHTRTGTRLE